MSHPKSHFSPYKKDSEGKNLFTWKQFSSAFSSSGSAGSSSAMRNNKHLPSFEFVAEETQPEPIRMVSEGDLLKEANSNLMKKILQRDQDYQLLQERLLKSTKENNDLLIDLKELNMDNQRYKLQCLALQEENDLLHCQLSSFRRSLAGNSGSPTSPVLPCSSLWNPGQLFPVSCEVKRHSDEPVETWQDLSEQMLRQMQMEIKEMEAKREQKVTPDTSPKVPLVSQEDISIDDSSNADDLCTESDPISQQCELESARSIIQLLKSQVEQLKTQLGTQGTILRNTLGQVHKFCSTDPSLRAKFRLSGQSSQSSDNLIHGSKFSRPSDELFRAYFTQQLHSSATNAVTRTQDTEAKTVVVSSTEDCNTKPVELEKSELQEKVCPICQLVLPPRTPQADFESHVFDCLDRESTLEPFEIV